MSILILLAGVAFTITGYFGPEDEGALELCGLVLVAIVVYQWLAS